MQSLKLLWLLYSYAMEELTCQSCGIVTTYADAYIADIDRSCEETQSGKHNWTEE